MSEMILSSNAFGNTGDITTFTRAQGNNASNLALVTGESGKVGFTMTLWKNGVKASNDYTPDSKVAGGSSLPATMTTNTALFAADTLPWTNAITSQSYAAGAVLTGTDLNVASGYTGFATAGDILPNGIAAVAGVADTKVAAGGSLPTSMTTDVAIASGSPLVWKTGATAVASQAYAAGATLLGADLHVAADYVGFATVSGSITLPNGVAAVAAVASTLIAAGGTLPAGMTTAAAITNASTAGGLYWNTAATASRTYSIDEELDAVDRVLATDYTGFATVSGSITLPDGVAAVAAVASTLVPAGGTLPSSMTTSAAIAITDTLAWKDGAAVASQTYAAGATFVGADLHVASGYTGFSAAGATLPNGLLTTNAVTATTVAGGNNLPSSMTTNVALRTGTTLAWTTGSAVASQDYAVGDLLLAADREVATGYSAFNTNGATLPNGEVTADAVGTAPTTADADDAGDAREYRVMYTDSSTYTSSYSAQNGVFLKKFKISKDKLLSADTVFSDLSMIDAGSASYPKITGSINGLNNGSGYGFKFTNMGTQADVAQIGIGSGVNRVIVNAGPIRPVDNFRVVLTSRGATATNCYVTINLADSAAVAHSTGRSTDISAVRLIVTDMYTLDSQMEIITLSAAQQLAGGPIVLNHSATFPSDVKLSAFEYALATVDNAGAISDYATTIHASSVSNRASNVKNVLVDGSSNSGTEMKVTWDVPGFSGAPITGYRVYYQEQPADQADWAAADVSGADTIGNKRWYWNIARATQGATVAAGATREATITGLTNQSKYIAWVRAVHAEVDVTTGDAVLGNIGRKDEYKAPLPVAGSEDGTWGGLFPDISLTAASAGTYANDYYFKSTYDAGHTDTAANPVSTGQEFADFLRGKPRAINTATNINMTIHNGIDISSGTPTSTDMRKSLAIKWSDDELDFGGNKLENEMFYFAAKHEAFTETELANIIDASFTKLDLGTGFDVGTGTFVDNDNIRYVVFKGTPEVGIVDNARATRATATPIVYGKNATGAVTKGTLSAGLELGDSYTFVVALKNKAGLGAHTRLGAAGKTVVGPPVTQKFNIPWTIVDRSNPLLTDTTEMKEGKDLGATLDLSNCLFDVATQSFQVTIADDLSGNQKDIQATGALDNVTYEVKVAAKVGDMTIKTQYDLCINDTAEPPSATAATVIDISDGWFPMTKNLNADGSIRLSVDSVLTKNVYDAWVPTSGNVNKFPFVTRSLSTMKGGAYTIHIRAKNSAGTSDTTSQVCSDRQVFGTKAAYALLVPNIDISLLDNSAKDVTFTGTAGAYDAQIGFRMRDLSDAEIEGRCVDEIEYRIYQTLNNGKDHDIIGETQEVPASAGPRFGNGSGADLEFQIGSAASVTDRVTIKFLSATYKRGYPIKADIKYRSKKTGALSNTPAVAGLLNKSSEDYDTATKTLTFATIPEDNHDEVGSMTKDDGNNKTKISWSRPNDQYDAVLKGYIVDLYDISSGTVTAGTGGTTVNLSSPVNKRTSGTLSASTTSYEFSGLVNGKNYMPVIHTVTTQGLVDVTSNGRSLVSVVANGETIKHGHSATFGTYAYFGPATGVSTANHFVPANCARPYGLPLVSANVAKQEMTIDNNGSVILYGAMIQVQTANILTPDAFAAQTPTLTGSGASGVVTGAATGGDVQGSNNVFYLDLSFGVLTGVSDQTVYMPASGYGVDDRNIFTVKKDFLGDKWVDETNYVFVSNKAGTTAGKISAGVHAVL